MRGFVPLLIVAAFGCKTPAPEASDVSVAGGVDMGPAGDTPTIIKFTKFDGVKHSACTGTFIRPTIILTAAHCVTGEDRQVRPNNHFTLDNRFGGVEEVRIDPGYTTGRNWETQMQHDLAWIRVRLPEEDLSDPKHTDNIWTIAREAPHVGALIRMVGYGSITKDNAAKNDNAREGYNYIDEVDEHFITINSKAAVTKKGDVESIAQSNDATTLWGDSGGPGIVAGQLVGVTSNGGIGWWTAVTRFVNLNGSVGRAFLATIPE